MMDKRHGIRGNAAAALLLLAGAAYGVPASAATADNNIVELEQIGSGNDSNAIYVLQQGTGNVVDGDSSLTGSVISFDFATTPDTFDSPVSQVATTGSLGYSAGLFTFERLEASGNGVQFSDNLDSQTRTIGSVLVPGQENPANGDEGPQTPGTSNDEGSTSGLTLAVLNGAGTDSPPGGQDRTPFDDDTVDAAVTLRGDSQSVFIEQVGNSNQLSLMADGDNLAVVAQFIGNSNAFDVDVDDPTADLDSDDVSIALFVDGDSNVADILLGRDDFDGPQGSDTQQDLSGNDVTATGDATSSEIGVELLGNSNELFIDSDGGSDIARVSAFGDGNNLGIFQRGGSNVAVVDIAGGTSNIYVEQTSAGNVATLVLNGSNQDVAIIQNASPVN